MGEIYELRTSKPLCGEEEFAAMVEDMVHEEAPRLFAIVQEIGEREDGRIAAWGLAFEDHTAVLRDRGTWLHVNSPERARHLLGRAPDVTARLVWVRTTPSPASGVGPAAGPDDPSGTGHA